MTVLVALSFSVAVTTPAVAQHPLGVNATKFKIAVVDIGYIFKKHERFRAALEDMKKEMATIEEELKRDRTVIEQKEEQRNSYNVGTPEYTQIDDEAARMKADFSLKMTKIRKEFLEREAKVYYQTYLEMNDAVQYYSQRHDIGLVLRFNGEQPDPNRREQILQAINNPVVFQNKIDITGDILQVLNRERTATQPVGSQIPQR
jgi:Skp family chaperone for outer membrane proteins